MDKLLGLLLLLVAVVVIYNVVIDGGVSPAINTKGTEVITDINSSSTSVINP